MLALEETVDEGAAEREAAATLQAAAESAQREVVTVSRVHGLLWRHRHTIVQQYKKQFNTRVNHQHIDDQHGRHSLS